MGNSGLKQHCERAGKTGALNLSNRKLDDFPPEFAVLHGSLRTLDLSGNRFTRLPDSVGDFAQLKQLNFSENRLQGEANEALGRLAKLEILNLSGNKLTGLPDALGSLAHLKQVILSNNQLKEFPRVFFQLKHLDLLDLSGNQVQTVPDGVGSLQAIELNLNRNQIHSLSNELADCPRLKTLRLEENCLKIQALGPRILGDSGISNLTVEGNLFDMRQFAEAEGYEKYMERYTAVKKKMF